MSIDRSVVLGRLRLPSPVLAGAGSFGPGAGPLPAPGGAAAPGPARERLGAVVTAGMAWRSRRGRAPRLLETPAGAVYVAGSAALGVAAALARHARLWAVSPSPVVVNLLVSPQGPADGELGLAAAELEGVDGVAAIELDLTATDGQDGDTAAQRAGVVRLAVAEVRRACALPILVKLLPGRCHADLLLDLIAAAGGAGATAVTIGGGLPATTTGLGRGESSGGRLIGPATFPVILALIARVAPAAALPLIAGGGIGTAAQARAYLGAGAAAVQVGSAHLAHPRAALDIQDDLG